MDRLSAALIPFQPGDGFTFDPHRNNDGSLFVVGQGQNGVFFCSLNLVALVYFDGHTLTPFLDANSDESNSGCPATEFGANSC